MSKLVAVQGCTINYDLPDDPLGVASPVVTVLPAQSPVKGGGKTAYTDKIPITVTGGSVTVSSPPSGAISPTGTVSGGTINISGSAQTADSKGNYFVLEGDEGESTFACIFTGPNGSQIPANIKIRAKVMQSVPGTSIGPGQSVLKVT